MAITYREYLWLKDPYCAKSMLNGAPVLCPFWFEISDEKVGNCKCKPCHDCWSQVLEHPVIAIAVRNGKTLSGLEYKTNQIYQVISCEIKGDVLVFDRKHCNSYQISDKLNDFKFYLDKENRSDEEMKFKVGDRVRVRDWDDMEKEFGVDRNGDIHIPFWLFLSAMKEFCGNIYTINDVLSNGYKMDGTKGYVFTDEMLIPAEFGRSDLKTGMIVETRHHASYMVYGECLINVSGYEPLINYTNSLYHRIDRDFDIIRVFDISNMVHNTTDICKYLGDLLWERESKEPEEKVISSDEAFKVLKEHYGCDVKIKES